MPQNVAVIGQGYVGLPLAVRAAQVGLKVTGFDVADTLVNRLNSGASHIDDVADKDLGQAIRAGYEATTDAAVLSRADVIVVCVPTPLSADGGPNLDAVKRAATTIGEHLTGDTLVILESTTYPGTTDEVFAPLVLSGNGAIDEDTWIAYSPERIDPGNARYGVRNTPKVVGGMTPDSTRRAVEFYSQIVDTVVRVQGSREAEMAKLLENTFRHVNIALVNEMLRFSNDMGVDIWDVVNAAATKPFGFMQFRPGPGVGGHCIPVDPSYLSHRVKATLGYSFRMVELAEEVNQAAPHYVAERIRDILNDNTLAAKGSRILLLGVAYKANISDTRESPATAVAERLLSWKAKVEYYDPHVPKWFIHGEPVSQPSTPYDPEGEYDLIALLQCHDEFDLALLSDTDTPVLDTQGVLPRSANVTRL